MKNTQISKRISVFLTKEVDINYKEIEETENSSPNTTIVTEKLNKS